MTVGKLDELAKWRIAITPASLNLSRVKFVVIMAGRRVNTKMLWGERLNNHPSSFFTTSCAARYLCEECKRSPRSRETRQHQGNICGEDSHQRYSPQNKTL